MQIALLLLDNGADIISIDDALDTPLHYTGKYHSPHVAEKLIDLGAPVNARNILLSTPLHFAAQSTATDVARVLLINDANPSLEDATCKTASQLTSSAEMVSLLNEHLRAGDNRVGTGTCGSGNSTIDTGYSSGSGGVQSLLNANDIRFDIAKVNDSGISDHYVTSDSDVTDNEDNSEFASPVVVNSSDKPVHVTTNVSPDIRSRSQTVCSAVDDIPATTHKLDRSKSFSMRA